MPLVDQIASARNTPRQQPAGRYLPHPHAFAGSLLPRQILGADVAAPIPQTPLDLLSAPGEPIRGRPSRRQVGKQAPARSLPQGADQRAPLLGRAPWAFGYG